MKSLGIAGEEWIEKDGYPQVFEKLHDFQKRYKNNRVFPKDGFIKDFTDNLCNMETCIEKNELLYRARVYKDDLQDKVLDILREIHEVNNTPEDLEVLEEHHSRFQEDMRKRAESEFKGYDAEGSFVIKDVDLIKGGRCNYDFECCLYVADSVETAISEVKPLINEKISVASIRTKEKLRLIDLSFDTHTPRQGRAIINVSAMLFMQSPTEGNKDAYIYTQALCSIVKALGYDGIKYSSCQNNVGCNYTVFNYEKCEPVASRVYTVDGIKYDIRAIGKP